MRQTLWLTWTAAGMLLAAGCTTGPLIDNPLLLHPDPNVTVENPVYIPLGPPAYNQVFDKVIDVVDDYFEIAETNRYGGTIKTFPKTAPGVERWLLPGSPDTEERVYATLQSVRYWAQVKLQVADDAGGGFFVDVKVFKELEDVPRPTHATAGVAAFRSDNTVERQFEVIEFSSGESNWIPIGRDCKLEQLILQRLKKCL